MVGITRGIKRLLREYPEFAVLYGVLGAGIMGAAFMIYSVRQGDTGPVTGEHSHWYGTVWSVQNCYRSKYSLECDVYVEGRVKPYRLDVTDFPGNYLQTGDRIGYRHRERANGYESFMIRNDKMLSSGVCGGPLGCVASYNKAHGYSK